MNKAHLGYSDRSFARERRVFLRDALCGSLGLGLLIAPGAQGEEPGEPTFRMLGEGDRIDIGDRGKDILEAAHKWGYDFEKKHGGCARCTVAALQKAVPFVPEDGGLFRAATCLDGGATPTGKQNCGGFTGSGIAIGWVCGTENFQGTALAHKLVREVCKHFEQDYGSVLCEDVRKGMKGNCPEVVGKAARWTAGVLLRQFTAYGENPA